MSCSPYGLHLQKYKKISIISWFFLFFFEKTPKKFVYSEKSRIFAPNMTSHASHLNSAPGEVFEFL